MTAEADTDPRADARALLLRQRLRQRRRDQQPTIGRRPDGEPTPLSFAQERLWFMDQFAPEDRKSVV